MFRVSHHERPESRRIGLNMRFFGGKETLQDLHEFGVAKQVKENSTVTTKPLAIRLLRGSRFRFIAATAYLGNVPFGLP